MGIGLAVAEEVIRAGARVVICARRERPLSEAAAKLAQLPNAQVLAVAGNVAHPEDVERLFDAAERLGEVRGVVHCAAVLGPIGPVVQAEPCAWFETIRINLLGTLLVAQAACRRMIQRKSKGSVVLLSGGGAGGPFPNYTSYACSKVAVVRLVESLALEVVEHGIRVNCVAPGFVATRMHEQTLAAGEAAGLDYLARTKTELAKGGVPPSVAARTIAFLLSPAAEAITGRFVAATHDHWEQWPEHLAEIRGSDLFTLRRIVPRDRGMDWQ